MPADTDNGGQGVSPTFNSLAYAGAYPSFGPVVSGPGSAVHVRPIPGHDLHDGMLPWPYVWLDSGAEHDLRAHFGDLVTITGVLAPAASSPWETAGSVRRFKDHFAFDPAQGELQQSAKTRANIAKGERRWEFRSAEDVESWLEFIQLYTELVERRALHGTSFDLGADHFMRLRDVPGMRLGGAHDGTSWGSMAITAEGPDGSHLLHIVNSEEGLRSNASYVMMDKLIEVAASRNTVLALGGIPAGDAGGMSTFKKRWSNTVRPSWLVAMILRPAEYADLCRDLDHTTFFPAYRTGW